MATVNVAFCKVSDFDGTAVARRIRRRPKTEEKRQDKGTLYENEW